MVQKMDGNRESEEIREDGESGEIWGHTSRNRPEQKKSLSRTLFCMPLALARFLHPSQSLVSNSR